MSINDELKVVWKTKCRWRDQGHLAKRKDLKPKGVNAEVDFAMLPLKPGDDVRIRFGKQWYDGDMVVYIILTNWSSFKDRIPTRLISHHLRDFKGPSDFKFQAFRFQTFSGGKILLCIPLIPCSIFSLRAALYIVWPLNPFSLLNVSIVKGNSD